MKYLPLLFAALFFAACDHGPTDPVIVIPGPTEPIVYSTHIQPIWQRSCAGSDCHASGGSIEGLSLASWSAVMEGSEHGATVVPFAADHSHMFFHINDDSALGPIATPHMPPVGYRALTRDEILLIRRWINEGAKNDAGEVALSGTRDRVFVTAQAEDRVTAIDEQTNLVARYISVGSRPDSSTPPEAPHNITLSPDHRYFYVNLISAGTIEKYDATTFAKLGQTTVGSSPAQIAITSDGTTLFVSNFVSTATTPSAIYVVDAASMTVRRTIDEVGYAPHGITLSADETHLYTTNANGDDISDVDLATFEVVRRIPISAGVAPIYYSAPHYQPYQSVLSPDGASLWVTCRSSGEVRVVNLSTGVVVDSIAVGTRPLILAINRQRGELWVPNQGSNNISIVNLNSHAVTATISLPTNPSGSQKQPHAVAFSSDGTRAYVSCENQTGSAHHPTTGSKVPGNVMLINTSTRAIDKEIEVGAFAAGIVVQ